MPWYEFFEKRIFSPLGMTNTRARIADFINQKANNVATPHSQPSIKMYDKFFGQHKLILPFFAFYFFIDVLAMRMSKKT